MRRVKADASLHAHVQPLKYLRDTHPSQRSLPDFGCSYRERLLEVELEALRQRGWARHPPPAPVPTGEYDGW